MTGLLCRIDHHSFDDLKNGNDLATKMWRQLQNQIKESKGKDGFSLTMSKWTVKSHYYNSYLTRFTGTTPPIGHFRGYDFVFTKRVEKTFWGASKQEFFTIEIFDKKR